MSICSKDQKKKAVFIYRLSFLFIVYEFLTPTFAAEASAPLLLVTAHMEVITLHGD